MLLKIAQNQPQTQINSLERMVKGVKSYLGKLIILTQEGWDEYELGESIE